MLQGCWGGVPGGILCRRAGFPDLLLGAVRHEGCQRLIPLALNPWQVQHRLPLLNATLHLGKQTGHYQGSAKGGQINYVAIRAIASGCSLAVGSVS